MASTYLSVGDDFYAYYDPDTLLLTVVAKKKVRVVSKNSDLSVASDVWISKIPALVNK